MKIAISNLAWSNEDNQKVYSYLKDRNIQFIEIAPSKLVGEDPYNNILKLQAETEKLKEKYNLTIISMQSIWFKITNNIFESAKSYQLLIDYTKKAIDFAASIKCRNLVFGCPKNRNMFDKEKDYPVALNFFKEIGLYALNKNVVIAVEPNPTIYNTNFLNYTEEVLDFVKQINLPSIKINYDIGTVIQNDESFNILKDNMIYINHIHISEPNLVKITQRNLHKELFSLLKEYNYQNYISIEMKEHCFADVKEVIDYVINLCEEYK